MNVIRIRKFLVALLALSFASPLFAQDVKIAVINIQRVLAESPQAQEAQEKLKDEFAPRERELVSKGSAFEEKVAKFQKDAEVMATEERTAKERELTAEQRSIMRDQQEIREDLETRQQELLAPIEQEVMMKVQDFAKKSGYDLVVAGGVLYASDKVNITEQVLADMKAGN